MAVLPTLQGRAIPTPTRGLASVSNAGAVGGAVSQLGQTVAGVGDMILDREATAKAKIRDAEVSDKIRALMYDPESGFMNLRGEGAVGARERTMAELDALKVSAMDGLNNTAQRRLEESLTGRIERAMGAIDGHVSTERKTWIEGAADARMTAAYQDSLTGDTANALVTIEQEIRGRAVREGWSAEETNSKLGEAKSKVYTDQITILANTDPIGALEYLRENQAGMLPSDIASLEAKLLPEAKKAAGRAAGAAAAGGWLSYANQGKTRDDPLSDDLVKSMSFLDGTGITMEVFSGGQEAAGEGGSRTGSTRHDHGNAADVFFYQNGRKLDWGNPDDIPILQGIVARARMAGVSGFGAGQGYMQQGSMHIGFGSESVWGAGGSGANAPEWLKEAFANPEKYAGNVSGGPDGMDALLEIQDPLERAAALDEYNLRMSVEQGRAKAELETAKSEAFSWVVDGNTADTIPLEFQKSIGIEAMTSLRAYERSVASNTPIKTDPETYLALSEMQARDPDGFRSANLLTYVDKLSEGDWKKFADAQSADPSEAEFKGFAASTLMESATKQMTAAGIDTSPKPGSDDAKTLAAMQTRLLKWQDEQVAAGVKPSPEQINAQVLRELTPIVIDDGWFGKSKIDTKRFEVQFDGGTLDDTSDDITPADLRDGALKIGSTEVSNDDIDRAARDYVTLNGRAPTVEEMIDYLIGTGYYR